MRKLQINFGLCQGSPKALSRFYYNGKWYIGIVVNITGNGILKLELELEIGNGHVGYRVGSPQSDKEAGHYMEWLFGNEKDNENGCGNFEPGVTLMVDEFGFGFGGLQEGLVMVGNY